MKSKLQHMDLYVGYVKCVYACMPNFHECFYRMHEFFSTLIDYWQFLPNVLSTYTSLSSSTLRVLIGNENCK